MDISELQRIYAGHPNTKGLAALLEDSSVRTIFLGGLHASAAALFVSSFLRENKQTFVFVLGDLEEAGYFYHDLTQVNGDEHILLILVSGVVFAFYKTNLHDGLMKITPYGKMSLTNYITQSIVGSMLYYNWGFALHNQFGITASCLAGIVFFILQFSFCRWWMNHHSHGPMEYIWKRATWLK